MLHARFMIQTPRLQIQKLTSFEQLLIEIWFLNYFISLFPICKFVLADWLDSNSYDSAELKTVSKNRYSTTKFSLNNQNIGSLHRRHPILQKYQRHSRPTHSQITPLSPTSIWIKWRPPNLHKSRPGNSLQYTPYYALKHMTASFTKNLT